MDKDRILLFIPGYNCEKQITRVLAQLDMKTLSFLDRIIFVNNRSTDGTEAAATEYAKKHADLPLILLRNDENYGLGGSHKVAFDYAVRGGFDYVIVLHGDDQGDIRDLLPVLKSGEYKKYDCCLGSRFMRGSVLGGYSRFRTFGNRVYNGLFSVATGRRIRDLGAGLNMYGTKMLRDGFYMKFPDNLTFNYCMILAAAYYRHRAMFFPISWREEDQVSNVKLMSQATYVLKMVCKYFFKRGSYIKSECRDSVRPDYTAKIIYENEVSR
jgi:glycosyltransferase involved in cell wall biosynthesis